MATTPTTYASGTLSATIGTETVTVAPSVAGVYTFSVDTTGMSVGDIVELRAYKKYVSGGTEHGTYFQGIYGGQPADVDGWVSVPISTSLNEANALEFSIKQVAGTSGRSFDWIVESY